MGTIKYYDASDRFKSMVVYMIVFPNGKYYVGQTMNELRKRIHGHVSHKNKDFPVSRALNKYGDAWVTVLTECATKEELNIKEKEFISDFRSTDNEFGYNIRPGGQDSIFSEETRQKKSKSMLAYHAANSKVREALGKSKKGVKVTDETKKLMSESAKKRAPLSEEVKKKISESTKKRWEKRRQNEFK